MNCPNGCNLAGYPQEMREIGLGLEHHVCPQCQHEIKEADPEFSCTCQYCSNTGFIDPADPRAGQ
jgi:hypothetical protein